MGVIVAKCIACAVILICICSIAVGQGPLTIVNDSLPSLNAGEMFNVTLHAKGGVPPYLWTADGDLPPGISLSHDGTLSGRPAKSGAVTIAVTAADSSHPKQVVQKTFHTAVTASLVFEWLEPPKVRDDRIDGSVQVSNGSKDTFDLTIVVEAVAENGRATAIGYQHFDLKPGISNFPITFGSTLPHGAYMINADAIAEIPVRNNILRQRLATPEPLKVIQGP
jgi:hypothetical protein